MALIQISNQSTKSLSKKSTIRFTQSICPDCNMILDAEVFERDDQVFMSKICPTHGECEELYFGSMICTRNSVLIGLMEKEPTHQTL